MPPPGRPLGIGAVVSALTEEFPDLTISKVRFLEAEGLLAPQRTGAGYRRYAPADVDRLRWVLRAQRDRYWPLATIREVLAAADRGLDPGAPGAAPTVPDPVEDEPDDLDVDGLLVRGRLALSAPELAEAAGLDAGEVAALLEHGVLRPRGDGTYGSAALRAARAAAGLRRHGLEARHLRVFRAAADRESALLEQATAALRGEAADRARGDARRLGLTLHAALVDFGDDDV
ncbi:transcriptional regulator FtsR [Phycicoccus flavus]|uniref:transcriptional regulator FtsR n=1 Tax=Phycicoccus flavus TaxID=2502783 RepID=UPI000FEBA16F|nr:MerR family transcriptional regulator [Phycicoccus flavus]NHA70001.1 MerR family transcriptional regulator [Phycicoccus flavus]